MKLFFASDIHGSLPAAQAAVNLYKASGAQHFILLGDTLNHGPRNPVPEGYNPPAVADLLNPYAADIIAVRGNCDSEVDQMLLAFPTMMDSSWVMLENGQRLFLTHGHIFNGDKRPPLRDGDVIAHGHTHVPVAEWQENVFIFNPGSVTFPRNGYPASYGMIEDGLVSVISLAGDVIKQGTLAPRG